MPIVKRIQDTHQPKAWSHKHIYSMRRKPTDKGYFIEVKLVNPAANNGLGVTKVVGFYEKDFQEESMRLTHFHAFGPGGPVRKEGEVPFWPVYLWLQAREIIAGRRESAFFKPGNFNWSPSVLWDDLLNGHTIYLQKVHKEFQNPSTISNIPVDLDEREAIKKEFGPNTHIEPGQRRDGTIGDSGRFL